jgi:hypothetical protein
MHNKRLISGNLCMNLLSFVFLPLMAWSAEFNVSDPAGFQNALTQAQANNQDDVITVAPGTYNLLVPLTYSTYDGDGSLIITANDPVNRPVLITQERSRLLHIDTNANDNMGGDDNADITVTNLIFSHDDVSTKEGGGIYINTAKADIRIRNCLFDDNTNGSLTTVGSGGGAKLHTINGDVSILECRFQDNVATGSDDTAKGTGGGLCISSGSGILVLRNNIFQNNLSSGYGAGAFAATKGGKIILSENKFLENRAVNWPMHTDGGGIWCACDYGSVEARKNRFFANTARHGGGAMITASTVIIENNLVSENSTEYGDGAGFHLGVLANNPDGTGFAEITNNTIWDNSSTYTGQGGAGIYLDLLYPKSSARLTNNIIRDNISNSPGGTTPEGRDLHVKTAHDFSTVSAVSLRYNILGEFADFDTGQSIDLYINDTTNYTHEGNRTADPRLTSTGHLPARSPAIDAGICGYWLTDFQGHRFYLRVAPEEDIDGDRRPGYGVVMGCDIGADEYKKFPWPMFLPALIGPR